MGFFGKILGALNHFPGTVKAGDWAGYYVNHGIDPSEMDGKKVKIGVKSHQILIQKRGDITDASNVLARYEGADVEWKLLEENTHWALVEMHFPDGKVSTVQIEKTQSSDPSRISEGYKALRDVLELGKRL